MIIYLDETYDHNRTWLLLGALFNPTHNKFHKQVKGILARNAFTLPDGSFKEIKYTQCNYSKPFKVCKEAIDAFMVSDSHFNCIAIETDASFDIERYGNPSEPAKVKKERAYRSLAEELLRRNLAHLSNARLFLDKMTRCEPKMFLEILKQKFSTPNQGFSAGLEHPKISHIQDVVSGAEGYELMGVCDLLQGCVLNNLMPIKEEASKKKGRGALFKNGIREYLLQKLGVPDFLPKTWFSIQDSKKDIIKKFDIHYVKQAPLKEKAEGSITGKKDESAQK
ncbi:MAG: hypothetical protein WCO26_12040 [Deltaproteobacteria bacterium]